MGRPRKWEPKPCERCGRIIPRFIRSDAKFCGQKCRDAYYNARKARERENAGENGGPPGRGIEAVRTYAPSDEPSEAQEQRGTSPKRPDSRNELDRDSVRPRLPFGLSKDEVYRRYVEHVEAKRAKQEARRG